jgi:transglutaminase-like putative cysteine protease
MSIRVSLRHVTSYAYDRPISLGPQVIRLRPAPHCRTNILNYSLKVEPEDLINWQQDRQSNYLARLLFEEKTRKFSVTVDRVAVKSGVSIVRTA